MTNYDALVLVYDLANENSLDKREARLNGLEHEYQKQQKALNAIYVFLQDIDSDKFAIPWGGWDYKV